MHQDFVVHENGGQRSLAERLKQSLDSLVGDKGLRLMAQPETRDPRAMRFQPAKVAGNREKSRIHAWAANACGTTHCGIEDVD
jgi:hypothetical protein